MPALLPPTVQIELLNRLLHRDLSNQRHLTNLHLHYDVTYPAADSGNQSVHGKPSFFQDDPNRLLVPKDPSVHAPLSIRSLLDRKLRWVTLGGQYNWTEKVYPAEAPPEFPADIASLLHTIFPDTTAEAAIVNIYSPGDTLSVHRDVSEECDTGLISISFGCEGLFMIGNDGESNCVVLRLRSGDAVYMTGSSRFAWHAVPKILPSTCPAWLSDWPGGDEAADQEAFRHWKGWMSGKRVNLNVRQMKPKPDS
jgi:DNA alkylation damage repair protein AlkB